MGDIPQKDDWTDIHERGDPATRTLFVSSKVGLIWYPLLRLTGRTFFDLMRFLLGEFADVKARLETFIPERPEPNTGRMGTVDVDGVAIVQARMASGAIGVIEETRLATGRQDDLRFEIHGSQGAIAFNLMEPN